MELTAELAREQEFLGARSKELHLVQFWSDREEIENLVPRPTPEPFIWHWRDMEPQLAGAGKVLGVEDAERRALLFANPGLGGKYHATRTLLGAYSLYNPGETAPVHRHTPCASRFAISGDGGFTTVNGEKCVMDRGDLILTPAGLWHDHGNDGTDPLIWMDVLDLPYVESLNCSYFEFDYSEAPDDQSNSAMRAERTTQSVRYPAGYSEQVYARGGILPMFGDDGRSQGGRHSPKYHYRWETTREALFAMKDHDGSPYEGIMVEYCDPTTGRPVMPNMSFRVQMLRGGEATLSCRDTSSAIYCCIEGSGYTEVRDVRLEWQENDVFVIPNWMWRRHVNGSPDREAVLYSVSDFPIIDRASLLRRQVKNEQGDIVDVVSF
jgi:gentisate 1,2-dioxygenase